MDGNTLELDPKTAEAMRQEKVFEQAMASLDKKRRWKEAQGLAVGMAFSSIEPASRGKGVMGRIVKVAPLLLVLFAGISLNLLFYVTAF